MTEITWVYWKRKEDSEEGEYISGYCGADDVPSYGEVREVPLPTEITTSVDEDGTITAISPPILGARLAYRYVCHISPSRADDLATQEDPLLDYMLSTMVVDGPEIGATRENWWWYSKDRFRSLGYGKSTPVTLMKKWKRGMMEIMLESHPNKDKILQDWDDRVGRHNAHVARNRKSKTSAHKKQDGDLVVLPAPGHFKSDVIKQVFRYIEGSPQLSRRAKHSLRIKSVRYRTPHGPAMTFKEGTAPCDRLSVPIRAAMCLLAWSEAPHNSRHAVLRGRQKFEPLFQEVFAELEQDVMKEREGVLAYAAAHHFAAAEAALDDFRPRPPHSEMGAIETQERLHISDLIDKTLSLIKTGKERLVIGEDQ